MLNFLFLKIFWWKIKNFKSFQIFFIENLEK